MTTFLPYRVAPCSFCDTPSACNFSRLYKNIEIKKNNRPNSTLANRCCIQILLFVLLNKIVRIGLETITTMSLFYLSVFVIYI